MAALPDQTYGVDLQTGQPAPMPQQPQVDPNSQPPNPDLGSQYTGDEQQLDAQEAPTRERVELCGLLAAETCAKAIQAGIGAENPDFAVKYGQTYQYLCLGYAALAGAEQKEGEASSPPAAPAGAGPAVGNAPAGP